MVDIYIYIFLYIKDDSYLYELYTLSTGTTKCLVSYIIANTYSYMSANNYKVYLPRVTVVNYNIH